MNSDILAILLITGVEFCKCYTCVESLLVCGVAVWRSRPPDYESNCHCQVSFPLILALQQLRVKACYCRCLILFSLFSGDPTIWLSSFHLSQGHHWTGFGHDRATAARVKRNGGFTNSEMCDCCHIHTVSPIIDSCPLHKFDSGLHRLHTADEAAVDWLTSYGT